MSEHLTEEEQIEALKRWWHSHGKNIVTAIAVAAIAYFGWQGWQSNQKAQREGASALYQQMTESAIVEPGEQLTEQQHIEVVTLGEQIKEQYAKSFYAVTAAMLMAKHAIEQENLAEAQKQLLWAQENNRDENVASVIDVRLARVYLAQDNVEAAYELVKVAPFEQMTSSYAEVRGDVLAEKGNSEGAYEAYQTALDSLPTEQKNRRRFIEMKRDLYTPAELSEAN